jgi:hypothetical protein
MKQGRIGVEITGSAFSLAKLTNRPPVEVIEVVRTEITSTGDGTEGNPIRRLTEYWSLDGDLLATVDPLDQDKDEA